MKWKKARHDKDDRLLVMYVEEEDGSYGARVTGSVFASSLSEDLDDNLAHIRAGLEDRLCSGEIGVLAFYAGLLALTEAALASYTGTPRRLVRRHLAPGGLALATGAHLERYSQVLGVEVAALHAVPLADGTIFSWNDHADR